MFGSTKNEEQQLTADGKAVVLGKKYKDIVHGLEGVATSRTQYLAGCDRVGLEFLSGGEIKVSSFDIVHLQEVADAPQAASHRRTGGPERFTPPARD